VIYQHQKYNKNTPIIRVDWVTLLLPALPSTEGPPILIEPIAHRERVFIASSNEIITVAADAAFGINAKRVPAADDVSLLSEPGAEGAELAVVWAFGKL
jgi:hypothetical protein